MEIDVIVSAISSVGFPIVMCGALFWQLRKSDTDHKETVGKLTESINNNTIVMTRLVERLGGDDNS